MRAYNAIDLGTMFSCPPLTNGMMNVYHMTQGSWTLGLAGGEENPWFCPQVVKEGPKNGKQVLGPKNLVFFEARPAPLPHPF